MKAGLRHIINQSITSPAFMVDPEGIDVLASALCYDGFNLSVPMDLPVYTTVEYYYNKQ